MREGVKHSINPQSKGEIRQQLEFVKRFPKELNPETWEDMARVLSDKIGKKPAEVKQYFITQLNINSIWETMDRLELDRKKAHTAMHQYGYTGSACLPLTYCDAWEKA
ncbi:3-oxoacyl-[acyl-carrier-protein] synthase III C-terminal domain-containing protein [Okeania hirsuta]|uniref:3-oxoacyl-[acyl-carrier-protein] synthase III C-terminal domain-containing protein n=1 Tax=Okeania hirsuta TaxID=1458930 RepID=UPI0019622171|nr:3-oxoacyl-[acyl-carrier-protein] synthase III C-terminal domain-containing protein [Okeania hirsuta]